MQNVQCSSRNMGGIWFQLLTTSIYRTFLDINMERNLPWMHSAWIERIFYILEADMDKTATYILWVTNVRYQRREIRWNPLLVFHKSCLKMLGLIKRLIKKTTIHKAFCVPFSNKNVFWFCSYSTDHLNSHLTTLQLYKKTYSRTDLLFISAL